MKTVLDYHAAHIFVQHNSHKGYYWNGYDIVKWTRNDIGFSSINGMFRNGQWGIAKVFPLNDKGVWEING